MQAFFCITSTLYKADTGLTIYFALMEQRETDFFTRSISEN